MLEEGLHGAKSHVSQAATLALSFVVRHVKMMLVIKQLELVVERLDLRLRRSPQEAVALCDRLVSMRLGTAE